MDFLFHDILDWERFGLVTFAVLVSFLALSLLLEEKLKALLLALVESAFFVESLKAFWQI